MTDEPKNKRRKLEGDVMDEMDGGTESTQDGDMETMGETVHEEFNILEYQKSAEKITKIIKEWVDKRDILKSRILSTQKKVNELTLYKVKIDTDILRMETWIKELEAEELESRLNASTAPTSKS